MKKLKLLASIICAIILFFSACKKEDNKPSQTTISTGKQITSFSIVTPLTTGVIDTVNKIITVTVPAGTNLTSLTTNIVLPSGLSITPASGQAQNFSSPVVYTVKLPDNTTSTWIVNVQAPSQSTYKGKQIISFSIVTPSATGVIDSVNKKITITVPTGTSLTSLTTNIVLASGVSITPASGQAQNFSSPVSYLVKLPDNTTCTWVVTVQTSSSPSATVTINADISQSVTWTADKLYVIDGDINIGNNAVLTIQPGTIIKFNAGASLSIGYSSNGTLIASGTADKPITFTSSASVPAAGAWDGIYFYSNTLSTVLKYCNIQYAGSNSKGALNLIDCDISIDYSNISNSSSDGIYTEYSSPKGGFTTFSNNTITNTTNYGIEINAMKVSSIGSANTITGTKGVYIFGDYNNSTAQTWKNIGVPYIITSGMAIDGSLTIEAGTTFKFDSGGSLYFGYNNSTTVNMVGTSANPITFTSTLSSPTAGAWEGLTFYSNTQSNSNMSYCVVDYAGSNSSYGAVDFETCSITFTNNTIRNCNSFGIILSSEAGFKAFNNNSISAVDHIIKISTLHVPDLGASNTLTAATGKGILVFNDAKYANAVTWKKQTADYYIGSSAIGLDGTITFEAGTTFKFDADGYFYFGYNTSTTLTAVGTSANPITFTSSSTSPVAGSWTGLYFYSNTLSATTLNYCIINYCGKGGGTNYALEADVSMSVSNSQILNCANSVKAARSSSATVSGTGNNFTWTSL